MEILRKIFKKSTPEIEQPINTKEVTEVFDPIRNQDRARLDAFWRIPGVFNGGGVRLLRASTGHFVVVDFDHSDPTTGIGPQLLDEGRLSPKMMRILSEKTSSNP
jgi:hypothetical protein